MADHVRGWIGVDASAAELRVAVAAGREPVVVAWAEALPMRTGSASEVVAAMSMMVVDDLDAVLSETTRPGTSRRSP